MSPLHPYFRAVGQSVLAGLICLGVAGCNTTKSFTVEVDAINDPNGVNGWSYTMTPNVPPRLSGDPYYAQVVMSIRDALSKRGMYEAPIPSNAVFVISFDYGERSPQTKVSTVNQPVFVQPGMGTTGIGGSMGGVGIGTGGMGTTYPGSPYPTTGGGSSMVMVPTTKVTRTSEKYLMISARENSTQVSGRPPMEVWRVEAVLDDEEADVTKSIPALVDAVIEYVGMNTGGPVKVRVKL